MSTPFKGARPKLLTLSAGIALLWTSSCGVEELGYPPPSDALYYPLGLAAHPDGRYLYVSSASFDRLYNASSLIAIDTFSAELLPETAVELGLFSGELAIARPSCVASSTDEPCEGPVYAYITSRDEHSLTALSVDASAANGARHLNCGQERASGGEARRCAPSSTLKLMGGAKMPQAPYGLHVSGDQLYMTHVGDGSVSRWELPAEGDDALPQFSCELTSGGAQSVTVSPSTGQAFVSDRFGQRLQVIKTRELVEGGCRLSLDEPIQVTDKLISGEGRGVAMSADGSLVYLVSSFDGALRVYDVSRGSDGAPRNALLAAIPVGRGANLVRVAGLRPGERRLGSPALGSAAQAVDERGGGLIYVSALEDGVVAVIDPQRLALIARVKVGASPHDIAFLPNEEGALRAFVTNFDAHSVSVIDIEQGSAERFKVLGTIAGEEQ